MRSTFRCYGSPCWKRSPGASSGRGATLLAVALAIALPARAEPPRDPDRLEAGPETGISWADPDLPLRVRARGLLAVDYRGYDRRNVRSRGLRLDRALIGADAEAGGRFAFRVLGDLRGTDTSYGLEEAWASATIAGERLRLSAGVLRVPLGIEHSFPEDTLPFVDYASPAFLTGRTDLGASVDGELIEGLLSYAGFATGGEGFDLLGNRRGDAQLAGKLVSYPFQPFDLALERLGIAGLLPRLFLSAAASHSWGFSGPIEYANSFRNKLYTTSRIEADRTWTYHLGYGLDWGPVRITHEFARQSLIGVDLPDGTSRDFERQNAAWSASLAWRITGEPYDSRPYRQRDHPPALPATPLYRDGAWGPGAIEVAIRYSNAELDRDLIDLGFASAAIGAATTGVSSQESRAFDVAVHWIPFTPVRITVQLTRTIADQRPAVFDSHGRDTSFLVRAQLSY